MHIERFNSGLNFVWWFSERVITVINLEISGIDFFFFKFDLITGEP